MTKKNTRRVGKIAVVTAGMAVVGAGAYYLLGPKGKQHQKKAKELMAKMKIEVEKKLRVAKKLGTPAYQKAVDALAENYSKQYKEHAVEIRAFAKRLKGELVNAKTKAKSVVKKAKRMAK